MNAGVWRLLLTGFVAFLTAFTLTPLVTLALRRWQIIDVPGERSSHVAPTPRGGGLAVAVAVLIAIGVSPSIRGSAKVSVLLAGAALGLVGLWEDVIGIPALPRLRLLFVAAAVCLPWLLDDLGGNLAWRAVFTVGVLVWLVAYANAFNFMDGINGIAASQVTVAGLAYAWIGHSQDMAWLMASGLILAAAALGFAPYNLLRARVFLGDVGSYFLGGVLACIAVLALRAGLPLEAVVAPLALFLADSGVTLLRRVARGDRWCDAHREHTYQRLTVHLSGSHVRTTSVVAVLMAGCAALGCLSLVAPAPRILGDAAIVALLVAYLTAPSLLTGARGRRPAIA